MPSYRGNYNKNGLNPATAALNKEELLEKYLKEFRVDQCPLFLQHKCQQHRPFTCFNWHFQNQRRRRPLRRRDGTFNYSADSYCTKYDETTGLCPDGDECPFLHRTAGDTERRYHLKYYKTGMCVHDTDNRGFCVKNGPHCAFAHGSNDLRPPVYDIRELQAIENGEADTVTGLNSLDKERNLLNDDPKWLDTTYVLANYKTEPCKKPPRLCRQGYACPQFHNNKDKRRSPKKFKYRSTPCPQVKSGDEWGDPVACEAGENCQYCHTRTEQQFHPEIYKSTKCNDIQNTSYCPRGAFCAFAHVEQETVSLESPSPDGNNAHNFGEILSHVLPEEKTNTLRDMHSDMNGIAYSNRAPGSQRRNGSITPPFEENGVASPIETNSLLLNAPQHQSHQQALTNNSISNLGTSMDSALLGAVNNSGLNSVTNGNGTTNGSSFFPKNRFLSGDHARESMFRRQVYSIEGDPTLSPVEKAQRKASLIMETTSTTNTNNVTSLVGTNGSNMMNNKIANGFNNFFNSTTSYNSESLDSIGNGLDDLNLDLFDTNSKSRKSSGFSETTNGNGSNGSSKSRQCSGFDIPQPPGGVAANKSRNCSGGSTISQGLVSGLLESNPVMIPGSTVHGNSPQGNSPVGLNMAQNGQDHNGPVFGVNQLGLFDLTASSPSKSSSLMMNGSENSRDMEIKVLKEELHAARDKIHTFDESFAVARNACEAWKKESAMTAKKAEMANKEKEALAGKLAQLSKEVQDLNGGGPYLHAVKRVSELNALPKGVLKTIEWQLKKDLMEVEKALKQSEMNSGNPWLSNNSNYFDFSTPSSNSDWGFGLIQSSTNHLFG